MNPGLDRPRGQTRRERYAYPLGMAPLPPRFTEPPPQSPSPVAKPLPVTLASARRGVLSRRRWWIVGAVLVSALVAVLVWSTRAPTPLPLTASDVQTQASKVVERALADRDRAPEPGTAAYATIAPSLVLVTIDAVGDAPGGQGAGVVVSADGSMLTAHHVVAGDGAITVTFADGTRSSARISVARPEQDIAVLVAQTPPQVVVPAVLGGGVRVGDVVYAVGHPFGLANSLSAGVVSATGRTVRAPQRTLSDLIQFDAAVNPGNSGGPLLDKAGRIVGIVTALANPTDQAVFVGIGFAVPIATAGAAAGAPAL